MSNLPSLDLIIPCFNPPLGWEKTIVDTFHKIEQNMERVPIKIILVNDGSSTGVTPEKFEILRESNLPIEIVSYTKNQGKGYALRQGAIEADSDFQIFTDVDFPYTIPSIIAIYNSLKSGNDVALGTRKADYYQTVPFVRRLISKFLRWVLKSVLKLPITDTQCGLKGFNQKGKQVFLQTTINRFLFDLEFVKMVTHKNLNLKVDPVNVKLRPDVVFSKMNYKVLIGESINFARLFFRN